jgi:hypothetical protein
MTDSKDSPTPPVDQRMLRKWPAWNNGHATFRYVVVPIAKDDLEDRVAWALDAAKLAIDLYYNGMQSDREFAERWLIKAREANQEKAK